MSFKKLKDPARSFGIGFTYILPEVIRDTEQGTAMEVPTEVCTGEWKNLKDEVTFTNQFGCLIKIPKENGEIPNFYDGKKHPKLLEYNQEADRMIKRSIFGKKSLQVITSELLERIGRRDIWNYHIHVSFPQITMQMVRFADTINASLNTSRPKDENLYKDIKKVYEGLYWDIDRFIELYKPWR